MPHRRLCVTRAAKRKGGPRDARAGPNAQDLWHSPGTPRWSRWVKGNHWQKEANPLSAPPSVRVSSEEQAAASEKSSSPAQQSVTPDPDPLSGPRTYSRRPSPPPRPVPKSSVRKPDPNRARYCPHGTPGIVVRQSSKEPGRHICPEEWNYKSHGARGWDSQVRPATGMSAAGIPPYLLSPPSLQLPLCRCHHCHRGGECSASYSSASWDARCRLNSELSEDQPMELHFLLVRLCGGRLRGESSANNRGEKRRGYERAVAAAEIPVKSCNRKRYMFLSSAGAKAGRAGPRRLK